jgi:hypothetical protein
MHIKVHRDEGTVDPLLSLRRTKKATPLREGRGWNEAVER